jgi:hypothetical protein
VEQRVSAQDNYGEQKDPIEHQSVTRALRIVPDSQYDTALTPRMKSHPGFHPGNLLYALAWRRSPASSSFLMPVPVVNHEGTNSDIS